MAVPFKIEDTVHHVFQNLGTCQVSLFIDMANDKNGDSTPLSQLHQGHGAFLHLGNAARRG